MLNYMMVPKNFDWTGVSIEARDLEAFKNQFNETSRNFESVEEVEQFLKDNKKFFASIEKGKSRLTVKFPTTALKAPDLLMQQIYWGSYFFFWVSANFGYIGAVRVGTKLQDLAKVATSLSKFKKFNDIVRNQYRQFKQLLNEMTDQVLEYYNDHGPEQVGPAELRFQNVDRMASEDTAILVDSLDKIIHLFKKNGFYEVLKSATSSRYLYLLPRQGMAGKNVLAFFMPDTKAFYIFSLPSAQSMLVYVFCHEFGHLVYNEHLGSKARDYWFESWGSVQEELDKRAPALKTDFKVTYQDRKYFFEMLKKNKFDFKKTEKKIRKQLQVKYRAWLYDPSGDFAQRDIWLSYVPDKVEPTMYAMHEVQQFFRLGAEKYIQKGNISITDPEKLEERFLRAMGLAGPNMKRPHPVVAWNRTSRQLSYEKAKERALSELDLPTEYSKTDALEDFSETFAFYLTQPQKLSALAKSRIIKTLKIARLYKGKVPFFASEGYLEEKGDSMDQRIPDVAEKLILEGHADEALHLIEAVSSKEAMDAPSGIARSLDSLVMKNQGFWKSEKQGKFLLDQVGGRAFQNPGAVAWAKKQGVPFIRVAFYQTSMAGFGHRDVRKIRMRGMVYLVDKGGVILRGKVKIIHPKGGEGAFEPDWSHVQINFRRPKDMEPPFLVGDPDLLLKQQVAKNKPLIKQIKAIPHWEEKRILVDFVQQLEAGHTLTPAQINVVKRMTPDGFTLSDKEEWQKNYELLLEGIQTKLLPAHRKVMTDFYEEGEGKGDDHWPRMKRELDNTDREYKSRGFTSESWIGSKVINMLEELVRYSSQVGVYMDSSEELYKQHQKAMRAANPTKKGVKVETFIQKAAEKLSGMSKQKVYSWVTAYMK